jgi:hypothetical protein
MNDFPELKVDSGRKEFLWNGQPLLYGDFNGFLARDVAFTGQRLLQANGQSQLTVAGNLAIKIINNGRHKLYSNFEDKPFTPALMLDTGGSVLENGKPYNVYWVVNGDFADFVVSLNASHPEGATPEISRWFGGFDTLCSDAGIIADHPLSGYTARSIIPASVRDLLKRPATCAGDGMVYDPALDQWVDIYLQSGTGKNTKSVFGGTVTASRIFPAHIRDLIAVGKRPLDDVSFMSAALGSNSKTNILGSANPVTTGGHVDTAGRRMLSYLGLEDAAGAFWQWIGDVFYNSALNSWTNDDTFGQVYACNAALAGGYWARGVECGAGARSAYNSRVAVNAYCACRGRAPSL